MRAVLLTAALTGVFCAVFAVVVDIVTDLFGLWQLMAASFLSGTLGSLVAQTVVRRWRGQ
ncbi:MAG: hypothetical protein AAFR35_12290 [Pseudomonadota bacterium]